MTTIKRLPQTRLKAKVRKDGVKQRYWCGKKPATLDKHPEWKNKGFKALKKEGWRGRRLIDSDGDGKVNTFDCKPLDATRQDVKIVFEGEEYNKGDLVADGEVYNVKEEFDEWGTSDDSKDVPKDWYEYRVWVIDRRTQETIAQWDSLSETFDGVNRLSLRQAKASMKEVLNDCNKHGKFKEWF